MKKTITILAVMLGMLSVSNVLMAQGQLHVLPNWSTVDGTQNYFYKNVTKTDAYKNVFVAGATMNGGGNYDILVTKYDDRGTLIWTYQYDGGGTDAASALAVDDLGNVYITGVSTNTSPDIITIKLDQYGSLVWQAFYDDASGLADGGTDIFVTDTYEAYVTGTGFNTSYNTDYVTIHYDAYGTQLNIASYDGGMNDIANKITIQEGVKVIVTGISQINSTDYVYMEADYGDTLDYEGGGYYTSGSTGVDQVTDLKTINGFIYICGSKPVSGQGSDYFIAKLDSTLNLQWEHTYNGSGNLDDLANALVVDDTGNVFVTGYTTTSSGKDYTTLKYNSGGTLLYHVDYNDSLNGMMRQRQ